MSNFPVSPVAAIVTSRLRRLIAPDEPWLSGMRAALRRVASAGAELVVGHETAAAGFLRRTAAPMNIPVREIGSGNSTVVEKDLPDVDRAVVHAADEVYVLECRPNGNIFRAVRERLDQGRGGVILVDLDHLQPDSIRTELISAGAQLWQPSPADCRPIVTSRPAVSGHVEISSTDDGVYSIVPFPAAEGWSFLTHTTRACAGPWPGQSMEDYIDSLMESRFDADHSGLSALCRILLQKQLIGSNRTIRGGHRVVSFTECPLGDLPRLHRFRRHRIRWDFEPYGICIRRDWLISHGAKPVRYGDDELWRSLSEIEQPFFQVAHGESGIDWSVEQEWRVPGDLSLEGLRDTDVLVFVPDSRSAREVIRRIQLPVTLWPADA